MRPCFAQLANFSLCQAVNRQIDSQGRGTLNSHLKIFAVVAAMALLVPAGASAKRSEDKPEKGNKHGKAQKDKAPKVKLVTANVKGTVESNDGSTMTVLVKKASGHAKACKESSLTFDVSGARIHTADNDADGDMDAADVLVGHDVKVRAKVLLSKGRKTTCNVAEAEVLPAKAVHNRTTPKVEDDSEEESVEEGESLEEEVVVEDEEGLDVEDDAGEEDLGEI